MKCYLLAETLNIALILSFYLFLLFVESLSIIIIINFDKNFLLFLFLVPFFLPLTWINNPQQQGLSFSEIQTHVPFNWGRMVKYTSCFYCKSYKNTLDGRSQNQTFYIHLFFFSSLIIPYLLIIFYTSCNCSIYLYF